MKILGISCYYHDAAACLVMDGKLIAAAEEERFTRIKKDTSFPINAIGYCLEAAGIKSNEIDYVAFYEKPLLKFERMISQHLEMFPRSLWTFCTSIPSWLNEKLRIRKTIRKTIGYKGDIIFVEHHLAHAASSYLVSPFKSAAILTIDGVGEWATTTLGRAKGNDIKIEKEIHFPHSLGLLYSAMTAHLGFKVNDHEYKVMGLAPYGKPTYYDKLKKVIKVNDDGSVRLDMSYFIYHYKSRMPSRKFIKEFGPTRKREEKVEQKHKDMAASLQKLTEEILLKLVNHLYGMTREKNLCMAGGVALNSVANGKILRNSKFRNIYIQAAAGDAGTCVGAAFYVYNSVFKKKRNYVMENAYLGPGFSTDYIRNYLKKNKIQFHEFKDDSSLSKATAKLIYSNNVIGWFQGRMEFGPRALGARSILSNACNPEMRDILNAKVKHRELFRPFAPVVTEEDAYDYFDADKPLPLPADYMLMVYPIKEGKRKLIPAVTHVDGSGRLQTARKEQNKLYYSVIKEFEKLSGVPILINTSYNIRGEPIVCTPEHAYKCMMGTGIDYLVMDRFLIARNDNLKDEWDSEKTIND